MELKRPTSLEQQLELLKQRGCIVEDEAFALKVLADVNYYRLSAYFLPFKKAKNYVADTNFKTIYGIYEFDRKLRSLLLVLMEGLETRLRTQISCLHAHKYGAAGYLDGQNFNTKHKPAHFKQHIEDVIHKNRRTPIVRHHFEKYDGNFPIWVIIELFTFGMLSTFYSDLKRDDQKIISRSLFGRSDAELRSWLFCLTHLRNACAHYSRLYYTLFPARPAAMRGLDREMNRRLFDYILIAKALCYETDCWKLEFFPSFLSLMVVQECIQLAHIGFPENWYEYLGKKS